MGLTADSFATKIVKKFLKSLACAGVLCIAGAFPGIAGAISPFVLYSTTGTGGGGSPQYPNSLLTVDPASGTQQLVGQSGKAAGLFWLTANPVNNILYGTGLPPNSSPGFVDESTLYTINQNSGAISGTVTLSQNVGPIAASAQGTLYGLSGNILGTINTATGQFSSIGTLSLSSGYFLEAMAFSPGGTLFGVTVKTVGGDQQLITLNPATGARASVLGSLKGDLSVEDITYAADGNIYATNFSYFLLKIDPQTLSITTIGNGSIGDLGGIAAIPGPSVPEPSTLALMGTSIGLMGALLWFGRARPKSISWRKI